MWDIIVILLNLFFGALNLTRLRELLNDPRTPRSLVYLCGLAVISSAGVLMTYAWNLGCTSPISGFFT